MKGWSATMCAIALLAVVPAQADQMDKRLDDLFAQLAAAHSSAEAQPTENAIWSIWTSHSDERAQRYMDAGIRQMNEGLLPQALITFSRLVELFPDFAEGWNKRATVYYAMHDFEASTQDIAETLKLEPRHFGALSGLGLVGIALGRERAAIAALEMALSHHPNLPGARENLKLLKGAVGAAERPI